MMRIMTGVGDLVRGLMMVTQVGYSVAGRSGGRVTLCVVCIVHEVMRSTGLLVEPKKTRSTVCQWFDIKITGAVFFGLSLKPTAQVFRFVPQNW
jgi:hypothetical protein